MVVTIKVLSLNLRLARQIPILSYGQYKEGKDKLLGWIDGRALGHADGVWALVQLKDESYGLFHSHPEIKAKCKQIYV